VADPNDPKDDVTTTKSTTVPTRDSITGGFSRNADLLSYIVSGLLIGLFLDWVFGISPVMTIVWSLAAMGVGFYRLWQASAELEEAGKKRGHGV
jgi:F0F1-type ATP synthase assembly protein I